MPKVKTEAEVPATAEPKAPAKSRRMPIEEYFAELTTGDEEIDDGIEAGGKIKMIIKLFARGYTRKEIISVGFNKSTVYRQTKEFMKLKTAPVVKFYGYEMYEARIQRLVSSKNITREEAAEIIAEKDLEG